MSTQDHKTAHCILTPSTYANATAYDGFTSFGKMGLKASPHSFAYPMYLSFVSRQISVCLLVLVSVELLIVARCFGPDISMVFQS